jgi:hypothetical protein
MRTFALFYGNLVNFVAICDVIPFWYFVSRKIWQPCFSGCWGGFNELAVIGKNNAFTDKKLPPYTLTGFDLTTQLSASRDHVHMTTSL